MNLEQTSRSRPRRRGPAPYISPYDAAASRWRHPDFEFDEPDAPEETPQADTGFRIFELPRPFETPPYIALPAHDAFGWQHGDRYSPLLKARTPLRSTRAVVPGFKFSRLHQALSMSEFRVIIGLAFHPYVVDFREQYGVYDRRAYWSAVSNGKRMRRSDLMTIDVIVTYVLPPDFKLLYHAISVKHPGYQPTDEDLRREEREKTQMGARGWTWELLRGDAIPMTEFVNLRLLYGFAREQNLPSLYMAAREFAPVVLRSSNRGSLDAVMLRVSRSLGMDLDDAYRRFSVAVAYGFLQVDHRYDLRVDETLHLLRGNGRRQRHCTG
jgi:hypothetical protein